MSPKLGGQWQAHANSLHPVSQTVTPFTLSKQPMNTHEHLAFVWQSERSQSPILSWFTLV